MHYNIYNLSSSHSAGNIPSSAGNPWAGPLQINLYGGGGGGSAAGVLGGSAGAPSRPGPGNVISQHGNPFDHQTTLVPTAPKFTSEQMARQLKSQYDLRKIPLYEWLETTLFLHPIRDSSVSQIILQSGESISPMYVVCDENEQFRAEIDALRKVKAEYTIDVARHAFYVGNWPCVQEQKITSTSHILAKINQPVIRPISLHDKFEYAWDVGFLIPRSKYI